MLASVIALCGAVFGHVRPAAAGPLGLTVPLTPMPLGSCPLFAGPSDPVYCSAAPPAAAMTATASAPAVLQVPPAAVVAVVPDITWNDIDPYAIVFPSTALPLPPLSSLSGSAPDDGDGLGLAISRSDDASSLLSAAYDLPIDGDLQVHSHSAVGEAPDTDNSASVQTYDASSGLSVVYAGMPGVTLAMEPDVAVNWSDVAAGQTRVGIGNRLSTSLARNLSLTLSAGYDSYFFADDPLQNYHALQQRIAMTWGAQDDWRFGLAASSRSEWTISEERRIITPGLFVTMPLTTEVSLTAHNDFGITRSNPYDTDSNAAREDYHNSFGLRAVWKPVLLARHALRVIADYALDYDTSLVGQAGLTEGVSPYATQARVALAMRF